MFSFGKNAISQCMMLSTALEGKDVRVYLSKAAQRALEQRTIPLIAEMELYFSCLIRMQVHFQEDGGSQGAAPVSDKLAIRFRPVVGRRCDLHSVEDQQPLDDFPIINRPAYVPHWLRLDYRNGEWSGKFGYRSPPA